MQNCNSALLNYAVDLKNTTFADRLSEFEAYAKSADGYAYSLTADMDGDGTNEGIYLFGRSHADALNSCEVYDAASLIEPGNYEDVAYMAPFLIDKYVPEQAVAVVADDIDGKAVFMTVQLTDLNGTIEALGIEGGSAIATTSTGRYKLTYTQGKNSFGKPVLKAAPAPASAQGSATPKMYSSYAHMVSFDPQSGIAKFDYYDLLTGIDAYNYYIQHGHSQEEAEEYMQTEDMSGVEVNNNPQLRAIDLNGIGVGLIYNRDGTPIEGATPVTSNLEGLRALYKTDPRLVLDSDYYIKVTGGKVVSVEQVYED